MPASVSDSYTLIYVKENMWTAESRSKNEKNAVHVCFMKKKKSSTSHSIYALHVIICRLYSVWYHVRRQTGLPRIHANNFKLDSISKLTMSEMSANHNRHLTLVGHIVTEYSELPINGGSGQFTWLHRNLNFIGFHFVLEGIIIIRKMHPTSNAALFSTKKFSD